MTGRLLSSGSLGDAKGRIATGVLPILLMLIASPFTNPDGASAELAEAIVAGLGGHW